MMSFLRGPDFIAIQYNFDSHKLIKFVRSIVIQLCSSR